MEPENNEQPVMEFENEPTTAEEKKIKKLQKKIDEQKKELEESEDRIKRLMAEFENFKKRSNKERTGLYDSVMGDVISVLLPAIDNLEKAVATETSDQEYKSGIAMVLNQIKDILKNNGVKEIEAVGQPFDPSLHEAVGTVVDEELGSQIIKEEYRKGYTLGDRVLRHSLVVVAN